MPVVLFYTSQFGVHHCFTPYVFSFSVTVSDGGFGVGNYPVGTAWIHVAMNFLGPNSGQGLEAYYDGVLMGTDTTKSNYFPNNGDGRLAAGKTFIEQDQDYAGFDLDELLLFNSKLTTQQITDLMNNI